MSFAVGSVRESENKVVSFQDLLFVFSVLMTGVGLCFLACLVGVEILRVVEDER